MDIDDTDRFRRQAEICREESNKAACSPVDAASWLRLADDFEKLAGRERAPNAQFTECQNPGIRSIICIMAASLAAFARHDQNERIFLWSMPGDRARRRQAYSQGCLDHRKEVKSDGNNR